MRVIFSSSIFVVAMVLLSVAGFAQNVSSDADSDFVAAQIVTVPTLTPPKEMLESGLGGTIRVRVSIDEGGNVSLVDDVVGPDAVCRQVTRADVVAMRETARASAPSAKFAPATRRGKPVSSSTWLNFTFPGGEQKTEFAAAPGSPTATSSPSDGDKYTVKADINFSSASAPPPDYRGPVNVGGTKADSPPARGDVGAGVAQNRPVPKQISGGVLNGKATSLPKPSYPPAARAVRASGAVSIQVLIDENGEVFSTEAVAGHPLLRAASAISACESRFSPTQLMGNPVKVSGIIVYNFVP